MQTSALTWCGFAGGRFTVRALRYGSVFSAVDPEDGPSAGLSSVSIAVSLSALVSAEIAGSVPSGSATAAAKTLTLNSIAKNKQTMRLGAIFLPLR